MNPVVLKFGGELLEDSAARRSAGGDDRSAQPQDAARHRPRRRSRDRRVARASRHREAAGRRTAHHRRADARGCGQRAGGPCKYEVCRRPGRGRRSCCGPDGRRRGDRTGKGGASARLDQRCDGRSRTGREPVGKERPALLIDLCRKGYVPVISSIGASREGELFNVNADTLAAHLAGRLKSPRLIIAGATAGVLDARRIDHRGHEVSRRRRAHRQRRGHGRDGRQARRRAAAQSRAALEKYSSPMAKTSLVLPCSRVTGAPLERHRARELRKSSSAASPTDRGQKAS